MAVQIPKYAKLENERRFLVTECPDLSAARSRLIEDLYISEGRLRLRTVIQADGARAFKLCKKYHSADPASGPIVNIYLSASEHAVLSRLPGRALRKRRHDLVWRQNTLAVDVFEGPLAGLVLCEAEAETAEAIGRVAFPPWAALEVTADAFFSGGNLARLTAAALHSRLSSAR